MVVVVDMVASREGCHYSLVVVGGHGYVVEVRDCGGPTVVV